MSKPTHFRRPGMCFECQYRDVTFNTSGSHIFVTSKCTRHDFAFVQNEAGYFTCDDYQAIVVNHIETNNDKRNSP
jgi:hypothetical protein